MDIMDLAKSALLSKLGAGTDSNAVSSALGGLLGGSEGSGFDVGDLVGKLNGGGLGDIASSWLGDGDNAEISNEQVQELLGSEKIQEAASQLGTSEGELLEGLKSAIPQMVDKSSSGGSLLDSVGGLGGLAGMASKFLK